MKLLASSSGKQVLQDLVKNRQEEYRALTSNQKKSILDEFEQVKAVNARGLHISS
jgi:hypothetical protein